MDNDIKTLADQIIGYHKSSKDGIFKWGNCIWSIRHQEGQYALHMAARDLLIEKQLIKFFIPKKRDTTQLTVLGWEWKSFEFEKAQAEKREREERKISWPQRNWVLIGLLSFFGGIAIEVLTEAAKRTLWPEERSANKRVDSTINPPKSFDSTAK